MANTTQTIGFANIGFTGLLTLIFITLKLCGIIGWSWFWVLSPILFSIALGLLCLLLAGLVLLGVFFWKERRK